MPVTKQDIQELLAAQKQGLVQEMDEHFAAQEKRLRTEVKAVEQRLTTRFQRRLKETKQSLRQAMQQQARRQDKLFETLLTNLLKYEFGKQTDWMTRHFNALAQQLKQTHSAVTHTLERQVDLEARIEKLEQQGSPPLA